MAQDFPKELFVAFGILGDDSDEPPSDFLICGADPASLFEEDRRIQRIAVYRLVEIKQAELTVTMSNIS